MAGDMVTHWTQS